MEPLALPDDLADFPGTFTSSQIEAASDQIRRECGWHIAPQVTETLTVESDGGRVLMLPTMRLESVTAVRQLHDDGTTTALTDWRNHATAQFKAGILVRTIGWPLGGVLEVDVVHGYSKTPDALLPVLASRCQGFSKDGTVRQESLGSRSVSYGNIEGVGSSSVLARFKLPGRP